MVQKVTRCGNCLTYLLTEQARRLLVDRVAMLPDRRGELFLGKEVRGRTIVPKKTCSYYLSDPQRRAHRGRLHGTGRRFPLARIRARYSKGAKGGGKGTLLKRMSRSPPSRVLLIILVPDRTTRSTPYLPRGRRTGLVRLKTSCMRHLYIGCELAAPAFKPSMGTEVPFRCP